MVTAEPPHPPHHADPAEQRRRPDTSATLGTDSSSQSGEHSGPVGNERLTALTGAVLLMLALVEVATVPTLRSLMAVHFFVGVLLAGPVVVKTASTGWRFVRYYTGHPAYRRKGPPRTALRVLAPLLVASTVTLIGSGIALAFTGPAPLILLQIHFLSFLVWLLVLIIHVAAYLGRVPRLIADDWHHRPTQRAVSPAPGRRGRLAVNIAALVAAGIAAVLLLPTAAPWVGWLGQAVTKPGIVAVVVIVAAVGVVTVKRRVRRPDHTSTSTDRVSQEDR